jgi:hypothetical protein
MMTRKNYTAFAEAVATYGHTWMSEEYLASEGYAYQQTDIAEMLADVLAADNARFDRSKFMTACALQEEL